MKQKYDVRDRHGKKVGTIEKEPTTGEQIGAFAILIYFFYKLIAPLFSNASVNRSKQISNVNTTEYHEEEDLKPIMPLGIAMIISPIIGLALGYFASTLANNQFGEIAYGIVPIVSGWIIGRSSESKSQGVIFGILGGLLSIYSATAVVFLWSSVGEQFQQVTTSIKIVTVILLGIYGVVLGGFFGLVPVRNK